jgi:SM-20-related protein
LTTFFKQEQWLVWIDELSEQNYVVIDHFLDDSLYKTIRSFLFEKLELFQKAGIGSLDNHQINRSIRGDFTYWLDSTRDNELQPLWQLLQETMTVLNRYCFLSLSGQEFHLAHYPPGTGYERHLDQFSGRNNRMISMIIYLNEDWQPGDGGELEVVLPNDQEHLVEPLAGRCVLFKSAEVPHAVLKSYKDRYSLTGWFLYLPSNLGALFG